MKPARSLGLVPGRDTRTAQIARQSKVRGNDRERTTIGCGQNSFSGRSEEHMPNSRRATRQIIDNDQRTTLRQTVPVLSGTVKEPIGRRIRVEGATFVRTDCQIWQP